MHGLLMARATREDLDNALNLLGIIEDVQRGEYPRDPEKSRDEQEQEVMERTEDVFFDEDDPDHLEVFYKRVMQCAPGLGRVIWGMDTVMENKIFDESVHHLQLIPELDNALQKHREEQKTLKSTESTDKTP